MNKYDLIIIGGGPIGLACGIEAQKAGLKYVILEKGLLVNSIYNFPINMTFFSTSRLLEIGNVPFISHLEKPTRKEALEYYRRVVESWSLNIHVYEEVLHTENQGDIFEVTSSKSLYQCKKIIISTGFYDTPNLINVAGERLPKVAHYYKDPHPYVNQHLLIVGAGNSACDAALETYYKGAHVTMVIRKPEIKPTVKYWIRPNIVNRIKEGSIKAYFNSTVTSIHQDYVKIKTPEGALDIMNNFVLAMTGYKPNYEFLNNLGISFQKDEFDTPSCDDDTLETNVPGIYIAGVVCGGMKTNRLFIENSRVHAEQIIDDIKNKI